MTDRLYPSPSEPRPQAAVPSSASAPSPFPLTAGGPRGSLSEGACYLCGASVSSSEGWHRDGLHWCENHRPVWSYDDDGEPRGAGADPFGRPDPSTHPEFWSE